MMNYACNFRQSETEKYFEGIIIEFIEVSVNRQERKSGTMPIGTHTFFLKIKLSNTSAYASRFSCLLDV